MSNHQPAVSPPRGRRTSRLTSSVLTSALLITALAPLAATPAQAALAGTGPISDVHGYPEWYDDGTVKLALCWEQNKGCLIEEPFPGQLISYPDNFSVETFWFAAAATVGDIGMYEAALEATHSPEVVQDGNQIAFGRLRFRFEGLEPNHDYTVAHPYGTHVFTSDGAGIINETMDNGCAAAPCDWDAVRRAFLGDYAATTAGFLRQTTHLTNPTHIGDMEAPSTVTGAPSGLNEVVVTNESGAVVASTNQFGVMGLISDYVDGAPSTPNLTDASDTGRSSTDNITNVNLPTFSGTATAGATVELIVDGAATGVTAVATGGVYSLTATTALVDGTHSIRARITDPVAGELTSGTLQLIIDTVAPAASVVAPLPSNPTADTTPTLSFTSEANARFECQLLPSNGIFAPCTSPHTYDAQLNGDYTFNVRATDAAGNTGANATYAWRIGPAAPPPPPPAAEQKDMNGDGNPDIVARDSGGRLWLYPSTAAGGFGSRIQIGSGWGSMNAILQPGDFNGDGRSDILARDTSGRLWLYTGTGTGRINGGVQVGNGWQGMTALITPGDFNGDNRVDLLARSSTG
ncbi:MAG: Ig-like domain-containing protein, partial [Actinomycetes bacterium]